MSAWNRYRVRCTVCNWRGYRHAPDCECYDEWVLYCRPGSPGPGCPSWITYPCPKGHLRPGLNRDYLYHTTDSAVVLVRKVEVAA